MRTQTTILVVALAMVSCADPATIEAPWLTAPGYSTHEKYFPLVGTVHDAPIDCDACHGAFDTFKQFDCLTCHDAKPSTPALIHVGVVAAYPSPPTSADCLRCHPTGASIMSDHGRFFPIGAGTKHNLACSQCHTDPKARSDLSKQQCNVCHVTRDAAGLAVAHNRSSIGVDYTQACGGTSATNCPQSCLKCHASGQPNTIAGHPSFSGRRIPHEGATCLECHDAPLRTDLVASPVPPSTSPVPYAADFHSNPADCAKRAAGQGCFNCHNSCPPN